MRSFLCITTAIDMPAKRAVQLASTSLYKSPYNYERYSLMQAPVANLYEGGKLNLKVHACRL